VHVTIKHSFMSTIVSTSKIIFYRILKVAYRVRTTRNHCFLPTNNSCTEFTFVQHFFRSSTMCDDVLS